MGDKKDDLEGKFGINLGGLEDLFKGMGNIFEVLTQFAEKAEKEGGISRSGEIPGLGEKAKGVYGFTIRTLGGAPHVSSFGNIKRTPKGPIVEEIREPLVDLFDEKERVLIIAELPGIEEVDLKVDLKGDILNISASNKDRKYAKEILIPQVFKEEQLKYTYKNGILEIILKKY
ncbi:MAG: Hsp20/alpha crystallin family protein [Armatimonadetes bacterium]|nr:Hsp20/alpha crystallin family protein [Armatimonadota bacterium]